MLILHAADLHLRDRDIEEAEKCLGFLVDTAEQEAVDLIIVAGDVFDSQDVKLDSKAAKLAVRTFQDLAGIAPVAVTIGTPSHDGKAAEIFEYVGDYHPIIVAAKPVQIYLQNSGIRFVDTCTDACIAVVSLVPQPTKQFFQGNGGSVKETDAEIAQAMGAIFAGMGAQAAGLDCPHILVGHFNVTGSLISETQILTGMDIEISPDMMALANANLVCLGHIHKSQKIKDNIFYSGSLWPNTWGEMESKGFYLHELSDHGILESRFIQTPHKKMIRIKVDFTQEGEDISELLYFPTPALQPGMEGAFVRCDYTVWQDEAERIDKAVIKEFFQGEGAFDVDIRINRIPRENIRADEVLKATSLSDKIVAMAALREETIPKSILVKADALELMNPDNLIGTVSRGAAL